MFQFRNRLVFLSAIATLTTGVWLSACSGGGSVSDGPSPGDDCQAANALNCGKSEGASVVLKCRMTENSLTWQVEQVCEGECSGAACVGDNDATGKDTADTSDDGVTPDQSNDDSFPWDFNCSDCSNIDGIEADGECKGFLTQCNSNADCCEPGLCVDSPTGTRVCTRNCVEDCPEGWRCLPFGFPDVQFICLAPNVNKICEPCVEDQNCNLLGDLCLPMGIEGKKHCSRDCSENECPPGYECRDVESSYGEPMKQCWPISEVCECLGMVPDDYIDDVNNCGGCQKKCEFTNAEALCVDSQCQMGNCTGGYINLNTLIEDGCEYICQFSPEPDVPDMDNMDTNCDGIDGDAAFAIFVSPNGTDIGNQTGNMEHPVKTITKALSLASKKTPKWDVYVTQGTYLEQVILEPGVNMYGGFNEELNWSHNPVAYPTIIRWTGTGPGGVVTVLAHNVQALTMIEGFTIEAGNNDVAGGSSTAFHIMNSNEKLQLRNNKIVSGNGGNGVHGNTGADGTNGNAGTAGESGCEYDGAMLAAGCGKCTCPTGGPGGSGPCANSGGNGSKGGEIDEYGSAGQASQNGMTGGGGGSVKGDGGPGTAGTAGQVGSQGTGGNGLGSVDGNGYWVPSPGSDGSQGSKGFGGGGGGGGGGEADDVILGWECYTCGASGGGGGGGGCPGTPGTGGGGGGGSFAVFSVNSQAVIEDNTIVYRFGGNGGNGGKGGKGGKGGAGGTGGPGNKEGSEGEGGGGNGGAGGNAGDSGGGGGGSGGVAYGIYWSGTTSPKCHHNEFQGEGSGGAGGAGGTSSPLTNGKPGDYGDIYNQSMDCLKD